MKLTNLSYRKQHIQPKIKYLKKQKKFFQRLWFWITLLSIIIVGALGYFIFFFPKIQISEVIVRSNKVILREELQEATQKSVHGFFGIPTKNILLADTGAMTNTLLKNFPIIEKVTVHRRLPNKIELTVVERKPFAVFCPKNQLESCFTIDSNGVIYEKSHNAQDIILVGDITSQEAQLGSNVVDSATIGSISTIRNNLQSNFQIAIQEVLVSDPLVVITSEGWKLYFNPKKDVNLQVVKMNSLLESEITLQDRETLQYIYLQYENKTYYK